MPSQAPPQADAGAAVEERDADPERTAGVIDQALGLGTRRFQFEASGEPFVNPDALDLMARARRSGSYCIACTNGTRLDRDTADSLVGMGFDDLRITTLAGTPEGYARTHPGASAAAFERLSQRLRYLSAARKTGPPRMELCCVAFGANAGELVDFARFARDHGADGVVFRPFDPGGHPALRELAPTPAQEDLIRSQLGEARAVLDRTGTPHNIDAFLSVFHGTLRTEELYRRIPCYYGWLAMHVDLDGSAYPCCGCSTPLGNVYEDGVDAVWSGGAYPEFRRQARRISRRGTAVDGCRCGNCVHYAANVEVFRFLHPIRARLHRIGGPSDG
jgi:MoaA/NifB/PqqE/SkfB family radical SAM enzyme